MKPLGLLAVSLWLFAFPAAAESVAIELSPQGLLTLELKARDQARAGSLGAVLAHSLGCTLADVSQSLQGSQWIFRARCPGVFHRSGQVVEGQLKFGAFRQALIKSSADVIDIDIGIPDAPYYRAALPHGWDRSCRDGVVHRTATIEPRELPTRAVHVAAGYRTAELVMIFAPLPLVLLLALIMMVVLNRRAAAGGWFDYLHAVAWGLTGIYLLWAAMWAGISGAFWGDLDVWALYSVWNGGSAINGKFFAAVTYLAPPLLVTLLCRVWTPKVFARRGLLDTMKVVLFPSLALIVPASWCIGALAGLVSGEWIHVFARLAAAVMAGVLFRAAARTGRADGVSALQTGELSDRLHALAGRCGIALGEIHIVPARVAALAEPIEVEHARIAISDYALETMTPAEIEAEVARRWSLPLRRFGDLRRVLVFFASLLVGMALSLLAMFGLGIAQLVLHLHASAILARLSLAIAIGCAAVIGLLANRWLARRAHRHGDALCSGTEPVAGRAAAAQAAAASGVAQ